jgi:hypothetical protein
MSSLSNLTLKVIFLFCFGKLIQNWFPTKYNLLARRISLGATFILIEEWGGFMEENAWFVCCYLSISRN